MGCMELLVSSRDQHLLKKHTWHFHPSGKSVYARSRINGRLIYLHRLILRAKPSQEVDHINHNGLDNRQTNIRFATRTQNNLNRRGVQGVEYHGLRWRATIWFHGVRIRLGSFPSRAQARAAYLGAQKFYSFTSSKCTRSKNT